MRSVGSCRRRHIEQRHARLMAFSVVYLDVVVNARDFSEERWSICAATVNGETETQLNSQGNVRGTPDFGHSDFYKLLVDN